MKPPSPEMRSRSRTEHKLRSSPDGMPPFDSGEAVRADEGDLVRDLKEELRAIKGDLQHSIERFEASNRELLASNNQVVTANEKLRSTNEELETSQEELKSLNEELTTVNQQLLLKVEELESSHADLRNLLASSEIATICLEPDYRIKWFTPGASLLCELLDADIGRDIRVFSSERLGGGLLDDVDCVLETLAPQQRDLNLFNDTWHLRRVLPYRTEGDRVSGVVITYTDITEARKSAETVAAAQKSLASSLEARVRERTSQLRMLTAELALTEERERRTLAQDLHDGLGQILAILKIKLTSIKESERRGKLKVALREIEGLIDQSNQSVRTLMLQLSPPVLQALGLVPALEWLTEEMERVYGLAVRIESNCVQIALEEPARTTVFRAVRELLINVSKHAGCNVARITCLRDADRQTIVVTDQGDGFAYSAATPPRAGDFGFGLLSIKDRIEFIGGQMNIDTAPGCGTTVSIIFPSPQPEHSTRETE